MSDHPNPGISDGNETWQLEREAEAPASPLDDPELLLWHFAVNSRQPETLSIDRTMWLTYARTLRKLLHSSADRAEESLVMTLRVCAPGGGLVYEQTAPVNVGGGAGIGGIGVRFDDMPRHVGEVIASVSVGAAKPEITPEILQRAKEKFWAQSQAWTGKKWDWDVAGEEVQRRFIKHALNDTSAMLPDADVLAAAERWKKDPRP